MKTEYIKVDNLNDAFRVIFSGENVKAIDLITVLKELDESTGLGWQPRNSLIYPKLWARKGAFSSSAETFVDAFDHTAYKETVWNFSEAREENSIDGLELHGWGAWPDPASWNDVIPLQKAAELKQLLATVPKDTPVFSPSDNFELDGRLKNIVNFYSIKDLSGKAWLILKTK